MQTLRSPAGWPGLTEGGEEQEREGRKGEAAPGTGRPTEQKRDCGGGRARAARLPGKTGRRDFFFSVCTIKEKGKKKIWLQAKRLLILHTHALAPPSAPVPRAPEQKANELARRGPPKLGIRGEAPRRPPPPRPPPGPRRPGPHGRPPQPHLPSGRGGGPGASPPPPPAALGAAAATASPPRLSRDSASLGSHSDRQSGSGRGAGGCGGT